MSFHGLSDDTFIPATQTEGGRHEISTGGAKKLTSFGTETVRITTGSIFQGVIGGGDVEFHWSNS